jgi:glutamate 5-kinase
MSSADCLVLLSDVDGFYTAAPDRDPAARHMPEIAEITEEIAAMAEPSRRPHGTGGMITKLEAARIAIGSGCHMVIALGREDRPIKRLLEGARATWFVAKASPVAARKQWIAASLKPAGTITVDAGAGRALAAGKSLLPAGVTAVAGRFQRGDAVVVVDEKGAELARGLSAYSSADAARIIGTKSGEIEAILGYRGRTALVHRDDLVITNG